MYVLVSDEKSEEFVSVPIEVNVIPSKLFSIVKYVGSFDLEVVHKRLAF